MFLCRFLLSGSLRCECNYVCAAHKKLLGTCLVSTLVGEVQLSFLRAEVNAWFLAHHLGVDGLVRLHTHHKLIPATLVSKNVPWHICELQPHFSFPLIQSFSTAKDERNTWGARISMPVHMKERGKMWAQKDFLFCREHSMFTIPAFVVHIEHSSSEGGLSWSFRNSGIVKITQFGVSLTVWIPNILTQHHIWHGHWRDALQHFYLQRGNTGEQRSSIFTHRNKTHHISVCFCSTCRELSVSGRRFCTFSSLTSSELVDAGFSMATRQSIWSKWFCMTSLITTTRTGGHTEDRGGYDGCEQNHYNLTDPMLSHVYFVYRVITCRYWFLLIVKFILHFIYHFKRNIS